MKNIIYFLFAAIFFFQSCGSKKEEIKETAKPTDSSLVNLSNEQLKNVEILTAKLEDRNIATLIRVSGQIDVPPQNMISVSIPLGGYLKSTALLPGNHVKKGEVIAVLEDQQYIQMQQDYLTAKTKTDLAYKDYQRQKELMNSQAVSQKIYQQAEADYNIQKTMVNALAEKLSLINVNPKKLTSSNITKRINIYSPINGFVSKVNANIGKYLNPADVLFELVNPEDIHLNIKVFEKDLPKLVVGQKVIAFNNSQPDKKYECEIILFSKDLSADHTADVHCHFEKYDKSLLPGMFMNAEIELKSNKSATLPADAIVNFEGANYAFVMMNKNQFKMVEIKPGRTENGYIEVLNPEQFKEKPIVIKGAYTLLMKMKNKSDE